MSRQMGEENEMIALTLNPIDIKAVLDYVTTEESGGIDIFVGTTRNHSNGKPVSLLEYEAYDPMAINMMEQIVVEAKRQWSLNRVALVHRLGRVPVAEASVLVAVSAAHRNEAFEACRFLIDKLKQDVPIWKREYFADGSVEWSGQPHEQTTSR